MFFKEPLTEWFLFCKINLSYLLLRLLCIDRQGRLQTF